MSKKSVEKFTVKNIETELGKNIRLVLPMIEEITKRKVMPLCLIGINAREDNQVDCWVATVSDDPETEASLFEVLKLIIQSKEDSTKSQTPQHDQS